MAYTNFSGAMPVSKSAVAGGWLAALRNTFARRAMFTRTVRELSALSNRELADLGLDRSMIYTVAHEAAYGN